MKGQIIKALSGFYYVASEDEIFQTRARGNFRNRKITPLVGDEVIFESSNQTDGYLLEILPRKNELVRPPVANVDQGVVVTSLVEPNFSYNLLDRFLVTLEYEGIEPIIFLTKADLVKDLAAMKAIEETYQAIGYHVITSKAEGEDLLELQRYFPERITVFMGQSGAGKSTLLNRIVPELALETGVISESLGRGKHTTRHVELLPICDGLVADTPGFSSIDFLEIEAVELPKLFPDFLAVASNCRFRECMHLNEPDCAVKQGVAANEIAATRYKNYVQFLEEIENRRPVYKKKKK
ncbi:MULTISPECIES: ribosome small subunit-dependent GTPase A [Enterococcus]|uniref:ribosome small subunit-dependent GTPase A n=1 Tax=Enterococcus TaxID=1350 RepID=UPI000A355397|nr:MULTISPECIES: ribosome small subunit-dependent GTPase A [Enterococcus]MBO1095994.1 ribosome small subunit-dependent GTPase A [Enterococcus casseliflavus]OTO96700.1 ribosome small subunit-dependent GTPase A [Enterococcus faecium]MBO1145881.1 ribosome small subunit-dependent GTPase A [Enterococcus casseliflavus]MBV6372396.1 ribosome small subunit-dependent GTPase A [Enterococcus casseliflavus]MEC5316997.1 ribosome small subunit-dependent GTPase A [Enterococcus casseliflavus]